VTKVKLIGIMRHATFTKYVHKTANIIYENFMNLLTFAVFCSKVLQQL